MRRTVAAIISLGTTVLAACTGSSAPRAAVSHERSSPASSAHTSAGAVTAPGATGSVGPRTVTILGTGDVLIHPALWRQAHRDAIARGGTGYDFGPMYASVAPDVRAADLAVCEMESPLAPPQGPFRGWPDFSSPPQVLTALRATGYDSCTTASNHSLDGGYAGVRRTLDELDRAGLRHTGSARSAAEAHRPLIMRLRNGVRVAQLAYAFGFNGRSTPPGKAWLANQIDIPAILAAAHRAKRAGADIVVVSMHWGVEYNLGVTQEQRDQARALLRSPDVDLILGDHPHVVEPAERIDGKWVVYSMGNQISRHADPLLVSREGAMPVVTFTEVRHGVFRTTRMRIIPTLMQLRPQLRLIDLPLAGGSPYYRKCIADIRRVADALGAGHSGLVVG